MKHPRKAVLAIGVVGAVALTWFAYPRVAQFLAVDDCLDRGGSYDYANNVCDFVRNHPGPRAG